MQSANRMLYRIVWLLLLSQLAFWPNRISCARGSSYIDDYFLPTAKLALNKIQQSFSPSQANFESAQSVAVATRAATKLESANEQPAQALIPAPNNTNAQSRGPPLETSTLSPLVQADQRQQSSQSESKLTVQGDIANFQTFASSTSEPNNNEFVRIEPNGELPVGATDVSRQVDETTPTVSSTQFAPTEPLSVASTVSSETATVPNAPATESAPTKATSNNIENKPTPSSSNGGEEAARDATLEAIAAVDESIGFGSSLFGGSSENDCYDEYGNARYCEPEFENIALERQVEVSSECGRPPSRFCTAYQNERNDLIKNCHICDQQHAKKRHPAAFLTDLNGPSNPTCWVSAPLNATEPERDRDNVTLLLSLGKKYEITYVSLQFCTPKPDSLAIFKSLDNGRTWQPYQFYSSLCKRLYKLPNQATAKSGDFEPTCTSLNSSSNGGGSSSSARLAFSTLDGRVAGSSAERALALQDWITATDIKIVLDRHQPLGVSSAAGHPHRREEADASQVSWPSAPGSANQTARNEADQSETSLTKPSSDTYNYAISDLTVGGRCKCNGHASRCELASDGRAQCHCSHNTAGRDCERCAPFHFDRPWAKASQLDASPCQPCNCNGHSRKCHFDPEIYRLSGRRSGGVCTGCQDNTIGRFCNRCKEGFTRDSSKPMSHKEACKRCDCHPIGSQGRVCNQTTGQCPCKEGVTGLQCNRCGPGYQQSNSYTEPCIKIPDNGVNPSHALPSDGSPEESSGEATSPDQDAPLSRPASTVVSNRVRGQYKPKPSIDDPTESGLDFALDDDSPMDMADLLSTRLSNPRRARPNQVYQTSWPVNRPAYFSRPKQQLGLVDDDDEQADLDEDPRASYRGRRPFDEDYSSQANRFHAALYGDGPHYHSYKKPRLVNEYRVSAARRANGVGSSRARANEIPIQSIGNLDNNDEMNQLNEAEMNYAVYSDENEFNQIHTPARRLPVNSGSGAPRDYAMKATILGKSESADWSQFLVEVQDLFKSSNEPSRASSNLNYIDQSSNEDQSSSNRTLLTTSSTDELPLMQTIKVGTTQKIWVPTEDSRCKCPKLRARSSYLLLGSIENKDNNSPNSSDRMMQLDRHGVALAWTASLQDKLLKYQRRQARGRC